MFDTKSYLFNRFALRLWFVGSLECFGYHKEYQLLSRQYFKIEFQNLCVSAFLMGKELSMDMATVGLVPTPALTLHTTYKHK